MMRILINNQKFVIKFCLGLLLLSVISLDFDIHIMQAQNTFHTSKPYQEVHVLAGDTVWSIASKYVSNKDDIRELIMAIRQINGLAINAEIYPGQVIKVPVKTLPASETTVAKSINRK